MNPDEHMEQSGKQTAHVVLGCSTSVLLWPDATRIPHLWPETPRSWPGMLAQTLFVHIMRIGFSKQAKNEDGASDGGGGEAVICRDDTDEKRSADEQFASLPL